MGESCSLKENKKPKENNREMDSQNKKREAHDVIITFIL
jgi:hypothetical protein